MTDNELILSGYSQPLIVHLSKPRDDGTCTIIQTTPLPESPVQVFADKFIKGMSGESVVAMPLPLAFNYCFRTDAHFAQYASPANIRLLKDQPSPGIEFHIACADVDYDNHESKPTENDFVDFFRVMVIQEDAPLPNLIYQTLRGARLVYLINTMTDPLLFEAHAQALIAKLAKIPLANVGKYAVDPKCGDWTRLFRLPRVVRDEVREFRHHIRVLHADPLDLMTLKVKPKKVRITHAARIPSGLKGSMLAKAKQYVETCPPAVSGDSGHNRTFATAMHLFTVYGLDFDTARGLMDQYNDRCDPPWGERELDHKVKDAAKKAGVIMEVLQ